MRPARRVLSAWLQIPAVLLLYGLAFPPTRALRGDALTVLTPGTTRAERSGASSDRLLVALPGAIAPLGAEPAADLATALRRHPEVRRLEVLGRGLSARDLPAAAGLAVRFDAATARGLVELDAPSSANLGWQWRLAGRAAAPANRVELRDPAGAVVDAAALDADGHFALSAPARATGRLRYELRLLGEKAALVESISVPLIVDGGEPLSVLVRAGALNPELKYWRRWAADAGLQVSLSAQLTEGVSLRAGAQTLDADTLAHVDVAIIDARGWEASSLSEKAALGVAVDAGMGLLLRADGPLSDGTAQDWRALGFGLAAAPPRSVTLDARTGLRDRKAFDVAPLDLASAAAAAAAPESAAAGPMLVLLAADDATPLGWWHPVGRGRIGVTRLLDSYRLVLAGETARYGALWADTLGVLARARAAPPPGPEVPRDAWVRERITLCGLGEGAGIVAPDPAPRVTLRVGPDGCAGYWPALAGWHALETGGSVTSFYVRASDDGASLRASLEGLATAALAADDSVSALAPAGAALPGGALSAAAPLRAPMARWPWFLAWLGVMSVIWWLERPNLRLLSRP